MDELFTDIAEAEKKAAAVVAEARKKTDAERSAAEKRWDEELRILRQEVQEKINGTIDAYRKEIKADRAARLERHRTEEEARADIPPEKLTALKKKIMMRIVTTVFGK